MRTIYRCYDGDSSRIEEFDTLDAARAFMQRRGLRYFDWAWCDDDQVREYYIPDDEDEEDYGDDDGAYMPSITPVLVEGEEEEDDDEEVGLADSIYVDDAGTGGKIKLNLVRERMDDDGDSTGEGLYVYINDDGGREYYHVIEHKCYYVGDVDPDTERVVDGITDNIWIHHSRQDVLDECANDGDYDAVVQGYALSQKIEGGIDDEFIEAVRTGVEEWLIYRDDCFVKDGGRWLWRDDVEE